METRDIDGTLIEVGDTVRRIHDTHPESAIKKEVTVKRIEGVKVWGDDGLWAHSRDLKVIATPRAKATEQTMSKPDFVPNNALFFASSTLADGRNILHATPNAENNLDIWIENEETCLLVILNRARARRVAQALLRWTDGTEGPEEI